MVQGRRRVMSYEWNDICGGVGDKVTAVDG